MLLKHVSEEVNAFVRSQDAANILGLEGVIVGTLGMEQRILVLVFLDVLHKPAREREKIRSYLQYTEITML